MNCLCKFPYGSSVLGRFVDEQRLSPDSCDISLVWDRDFSNDLFEQEHQIVESVRFLQQWLLVSKSKRNREALPCCCICIHSFKSSITKTLILEFKSKPSTGPRPKYNCYI